MNRRTLLKQSLHLTAALPLLASLEAQASIHPRTTVQPPDLEHGLEPLRSALERLSQTPLTAALQHSSSHSGMTVTDPKTPLHPLEQPLRAGLSALLTGLLLPGIGSGNASVQPSVGARSEGLGALSSNAEALAPEVGASFLTFLQGLKKVETRELEALQQRLRGDKSLRVRVESALERGVRASGPPQPRRLLRLLKAELDRQTRRLEKTPAAQLLADLHSSETQLLAAARQVGECWISQQTDRLPAQERYALGPLKEVLKLLQQARGDSQIGRRMAPVADSASGESDTKGSGGAQGAVNAVPMDPKEWENQSPYYYGSRDSSASGDGGMLIGAAVGGLGLILLSVWAYMSMSGALVYTGPLAALGSLFGFYLTAIVLSVVATLIIFGIIVMAISSDTSGAFG